MNQMKEGAMRRANGILLLLLLILEMASPALAAVHRYISLILRVFSKPRQLCPSTCPNSASGDTALFLASLCVLGSFVSPASAADYDLPILRGSSQPPAPVLSVGPATFTRWSGFYVGGNVSLGSATSDFSTATRPLVADSLQFTTVETEVHPSQFRVLGRGSAVAAGGGAFLGYNTQWQDLILGVEATYTHTNLNTTASSVAVARIFPSVSTTVGVGATGNLNLTDFATARGRAGYVVGNFLPYGFLGMAVGRASYSVSTLTAVAQPAGTSTDLSCFNTGQSTPTCDFFSFANSAGQTNALLWGYTVGAGLDWAITPNIFARGEFEFVQFAPITNISVSVASGRLGAGLKF
jgi:outer membrane immunogenic protein